MMKSIHSLAAFLILLCCAACTESGPKLSDRILDRANLLTEQQEDSIFTLIKELDTKVGSQIAVLTVDSLYGERIERFSLRMADSLNLGRPEFDDGLLITLTLQERKARIEVGTGLENIIKDDIANFILRGDMLPKFKDKKYADGIYTSVDKLSKFIFINKDRIGSTGK